MIHSGWDLDLDLGCLGWVFVLHGRILVGRFVLRSTEMHFLVDRSDKSEDYGRQ